MESSIVDIGLGVGAPVAPGVRSSVGVFSAGRFYARSAGFDPPCAAVRASRLSFRPIRLLFVFLCVLFAAGCEFSPRAGAPLTQAGRSGQSGGWSLFDAALAYSAPRHGLALLDTQQSDPGDALWRIDEFLTLLDERVELRTKGEGEGSAAQVVSIEAIWLPIRRPGREQAFVETIRARLAQLRALHEK